MKLKHKNSEKTLSETKNQKLVRLDPKIYTLANGEKNILQVKDLSIYFKTGRKKILNVIRNIDFEVREKQVVGLVGESGSGKSVTSKSFLNLSDKAIVTAQEMLLDGIDLRAAKDTTWNNKIRGKLIGYIPQDPLTALNPTRTIGKQLLDVLDNDPRFINRQAKKTYLINLLLSFGIRDAEKLFQSYPHTFSGGMKQRVVIAMVVAMQPKLIIADEPTTALDPTVQASVLALFEKIRTEHNISIIFISHNISVVAKFCDYIYVMYAGKILEKAPKEKLFSNPQHPYTWALISSIPEDKKTRLYNIKGNPPDLANLPLGDPFAPRNEYALAIDFKKEPPLFQVSKAHYAATWLLDPRAPKVKKSQQLIDRVEHFRKVLSNEESNSRS